MFHYVQINNIHAMVSDMHSMMTQYETDRLRDEQRAFAEQARQDAENYNRARAARAAAHTTRAAGAAAAARSRSRSRSRSGPRSRAARAGPAEA